MISFLARRLALGLGTLLVLSFIVYGMLAAAFDPLDDLRASTAPNKEALIQGRIALLQLDRPWYERYVTWLGNFIRGDFGDVWRTQQTVNQLAPGAIATSLQLVAGATIIAVLLGVTVGMLSALRQYTGFDYVITLATFVLYSLPVFWVAVLLKQYLAIGFNDFLASPSMNWVLAIALSLLGGLFWMGALGGNARRKATVFGIVFAATLAIFAFAVMSGWLLNPSLGIVGVGLIGVGTALLITALFAGMANRRALYAALTTAVVGIALYIPLQWVFYYVPGSNLLLLGLLATTIAVSMAIGWLFGGPDRGVSMRGAVIVGMVMALATYVDRVMQGWRIYSDASIINNRPIATIGAETPALGGDFWIASLDRFTHLLLPTIALVLISFATYTRYQRGSMLEVMSQDYIRTARAKGLPERVVIVRHAMRNALMPLASVLPIDFVTMIGGAVITETIFSWSGMGRFFIEAISGSMIDPAMFYVMLTGSAAIIANLLADLLYAVIDPRIRVS